MKFRENVQKAPTVESVTSARQVKEEKFWSLKNKKDGGTKIGQNLR